uniref:Uncharacterized protein n=1 Tax=Anguilla anguilla TaxID=7936 RepID=A0A0E9T765_ANGAN
MEYEANWRSAKTYHSTPGDRLRHLNQCQIGLAFHLISWRLKWCTVLL